MITCNVCERTLEERFGDKDGKCSDCVWYRRKKITDPCAGCRKPINRWAAFFCPACGDKLDD